MYGCRRGKEPTGGCETNAAIEKRDGTIRHQRSVESGIEKEYEETGENERK